ncbi:HNH endonuclease [Gemmatimonas sp.]|uniref:HNH endonuclease n=1 Tax=Gemmatimonas sp. TaxID=1962908 RepID=UPI00286C6E07|nr:HNH endonuclease [Gemmatimonas sp.]
MGKAGRDVIGGRRGFLGVEESGQLIKDHATTAIREIHRSSDDRQNRVNRFDIFARDEFRCVYCGLVHEADALSVDHVQPRMRGGDGSHGNVVTACRSCNTLKGSQSLPRFLAESPEARRNFFKFARYVHARHVKAVAEELARRGVVVASTELVEGIRGLRSSEAIAKFLQQQHPSPQTGTGGSQDTEGE